MLRLTASDSQLSNFDETTVVVSVANTKPTVGAGPDLSVTQPNAATLNGSVTDDGLPNPPGTTTKSWTKTSGPGTVSFTAPSQPVTDADLLPGGDLRGAVDRERLAAEQLRRGDRRGRRREHEADRERRARSGSHPAGRRNAERLGRPTTVFRPHRHRRRNRGPRNPDRAPSTFGNASLAATTATFSSAGHLRATADRQRLGPLRTSTRPRSRCRRRRTTRHRWMPVRPIGDLPDARRTCPRRSPTMDSPTPRRSLTITWAQQSGPGTVTVRRRRRRPRPPQRSPCRARTCSA